MTTIADLHKLAYTRVPRDRVHTVLHDAAVAIGRASLKACLPHELDELAQHIRRLGTRPQTGPGGPRGDAYGPRERDSHRRTDATLKRPRRGSGGDPHLKMISPDQKRLIGELLGELRRNLNWTEAMCSNWLRKYFAADSIDALATSAQAGEAIRRLMQIKRQKTGGRR